MPSKRPECAIPSPVPLTRLADARLTCTLHDSQPQAALGGFLRCYYDVLFALLLHVEIDRALGLKFKIPATVQFKTVKQKLSDGGRNGLRRAGPSGRLIKPV